MQFEKIKVTTKMCEEALANRYHKQRKVTEDQVVKLKEAIDAGLWRENGATIVFNRDGQLIDGQHRLEAIRRSGKSVWCLYVTGVDNTEDTFNTIDDGKARSLPDFIHVHNAFHTAAVARIYYLVKHDIFPNHQKIPIAVCLKETAPFLDLFSESSNIVRDAAKVTAFGGFLGFLWFHYRYELQLDESRVDEFFARLGDGVNLGEGNPIAALRNKCLERRRSNTRIMRIPM